MSKSMKILSITLLALVVGWVAAPPLHAQAAGATLEGKVVDESGAVLPGVTVTVSDPASGFNRVAVTGGDGTFRVLALPPSTYNVEANLSGFAKVKLEGVVLNVATKRGLEITLKVASVEEAIVVTDEAPLVATSPAIGTVVSQQELESLPLNGRQFANLAQLAPGTTLAYNSDPTKPGQQTVALNGGIGRNVNYVVDGGDNTDDTIGGALQNFSLEGVQEFKIQTQQYKAEYGRSSGGVLTVVTRGGTNDFDGSVYGFFRDKSLNSETESEKKAGQGKSDYKRKQYGASIGGPIVRDHAHFFVTYEKTKRDTNYTVDTSGLFPAIDGSAVPIPFEDELATLKGTWDVNPRNFLQVRFGYQKNSDKYGASPLTVPTALGTVENKYRSGLIGYNLQIGSDMLNEALFQYTKFNNSISADSTLPALIFPGGVTAGQNINTPQTTNQVKYQYKDDFSFSLPIGSQRHDFKAGANYIHEPTLGGDFSTGLSGQYTLRDDAIGSPVTDITINGGFFGESTPVDQYSLYFQDDWSVNDRLTLNLGLRYDYWTGFDLDQRSNPLWQTLSTQTTFNEFYLRDFQGGKGGVLKNDKNNWGPRLGFTWDLSGSGKRLLRGGWGIYYDFPYTNATILFPAAAVQSNFGAVYNVNDPNGIKNPDGSFFQPGQALPPNQLPHADVPLPNEVASPTLATPYSKQASLGYSDEVTNWLGVNIELVSIRYRDIPYRFRANPFVDANGNNTVDPNETRRFPAFSNFRIWYGKGFASYDAINLSARARLTNKFQLQGFYTYSEAKGNVLAGADEFRLTDAGYQPDLGIARDVSVNPLDPQCSACTGPLNTDARHRITLSGVYQAPWGINLSGVLRYRSATPYTEHAGQDLNGDGFRLDLPPGVSNVNSRRGHSFTQIDLRVSKELSFGGDFGVEVIAEVFNLFNETNPAGYNGNRNSANFGQPSTFAGDPLQGEQRLAQLGVRIRF